jgi:hypothetical protein
MIPHDDPVVHTLHQLREGLVALAPCHLRHSTRRRLGVDQLSVNAYPTLTGGFIYVGTPAYAMPAEPDLALLFDRARHAGIAWLLIDSGGAVVDGLPRFDA